MARHARRAWGRHFGRWACDDRVVSDAERSEGQRVDTAPVESERVMVFIDGQNLFKGLQRRYRARLHPVLLARTLAGEGRRLVGTRYYSGIHDPDENAQMFEVVRRRHDLIERTGVRVTERTLRYHWEWRVQDRDLDPPWHDTAPDVARARVKRHRGAREKGIDVALALDAVGALLSDECDTAIIVSRDRDLMEIADEVAERGGVLNGRRRQVEVAFVSEERGDERTLAGYDAFHEIDRDVVEACRDRFDYFEPLDDADVDAFLASL